MLSLLNVLERRCLPWLEGDQFESMRNEEKLNCAMFVVDVVFLLAKCVVDVVFVLGKFA